MFSNSFVLTDARLVLEDRVIENGWISVENGKIAELGEATPPRAGAASRPMQGDTIVPGLIELHTDHLETHVQPRPKVRWNPMSAVLAYDVQIAGAGITTVFDCIRVGTDGDNPEPDLTPTFEVVQALQTGGANGLLKAEHHTHLRCELCSPNVIYATTEMLARFPIGIMSVMDHTPGQRQFRDKAKLKIYYEGKLGWNDEALEAYFQERLLLHERNSGPNRRALVALAHQHGVTLASHDDTTADHVRESIADGARVAEFPTTIEAAQASHAAGIGVMMGAPNVMLGGSHSGNVAAVGLAEAGFLDILSSDYVPVSLMQAAFTLPTIVPSIDLPSAIAMVTSTPAAAVGLKDRGKLEAGLRADLVRVHCRQELPVVREVYREGARVV